MKKVKLSPLARSGQGNISSQFINRGANAAPNGNLANLAIGGGEVALNPNASSKPLLSMRGKGL